MMNLNRNYGAPWGNLVPPPLPQPTSNDSMKFMMNYPPNKGFVGGRGNWKGKRGKKGVVVELQSQNKLKAKRVYPKKKFNNRFAPFAPRNTSSFIIRAKKSGGIASLVSPYPVTPAVLPTPVFSPWNEVLGDIAKEEWGVNGYGSMNGLIRLRSPWNEIDEEEEGGEGSSESDVEHAGVERRLDHDLSRFEMIYPSNAENQIEDRQGVRVVQLEEENLTLKERLFLMERELVGLKMRMQCLEDASQANKEKKDLVERDADKDHKHNGHIETGNTNKTDNEEHDGTSENEDGGDVSSEKSFCDSD